MNGSRAESAAMKVSKIVTHSSDSIDKMKRASIERAPYLR
jgi:hypothetical protein